MSSEFGFVFAWDDLSDTCLVRINDFISDKSYMDKDTTNILQNGSAFNKDLSREDKIFGVMF